VKSEFGPITYTKVIGADDDTEKPVISPMQTMTAEQIADLIAKTTGEKIDPINIEGALAKGLPEDAAKNPVTACETQPVIEPVEADETSTDTQAIDETNTVSTGAKLKRKAKEA